MMQNKILIKIALVLLSTLLLVSCELSSYWCDKCGKEYSDGNYHDVQKDSVDMTLCEDCYQDYIEQLHQNYIENQYKDFIQNQGK